MPPSEKLTEEEWKLVVNECAKVFAEAFRPLRTGYTPADIMAFLKREAPLIEDMDDG